MIYTDPWLTDNDHRRIEAATSFQPLVEVAIEVIKRKRIPSVAVTQVCGPMASGGGDLEENNARIARVIATLREKGVTVFSQLPFQRGMLNFLTVEGYRQNPHELLQGFYKPLFRGGHIRALTFVKGWECSFGCRWEHDMGKSLGMHISVFVE